MYVSVDANFSLSFHQKKTPSHDIYILLLYADGQMVATRLSKQVKKATAAVKKGVALYNGVGGMKPGSKVPDSISETDALVPTSDVFASVLVCDQVGKI
jgi:hypothetical protein